MFINYIICFIAYSDSDSEWSSLERQRVADVLGKVNKKPPSHKRIRKKRTAIPVAAPKVPSLASMGSGDGIVGLNYNVKEDKSWRVNPTERGIICIHYDDSVNCFIIKICYMMIFLLVSSETPDSSESSDPDHSRSRAKQYKHAAASLRKRFGNSLPQHLPTSLQHPYNVKHMTQEMFSASCK